MEFTKSTFLQVLLSSGNVVTLRQIRDDLLTDPPAIEQSCLRVGEPPLEVRYHTIVSALAAGLHRLDYGTNKITTALEYKRRLISSIYNTDKNESSMNGVPVALSQKFCHLRLPLDLTEEELFLPPVMVQPHLISA